MVRQAIDSLGFSEAKYSVQKAIARPPMFYPVNQLLLMLLIMIGRTYHDEFQCQECPSRRVAAHFC